MNTKLPLSTNQLDIYVDQMRWADGSHLNIGAIVTITGDLEGAVEQSKARWVYIVGYAKGLVVVFAVCTWRAGTKLEQHDDNDGE